MWSPKSNPVFSNGHIGCVCISQYSDWTKIYRRPHKSIYAIRSDFKWFSADRVTCISSIVLHFVISDTWAPLNIKHYSFRSVLKQNIRSVFSLSQSVRLFFTWKCFRGISLSISFRDGCAQGLKALVQKAWIEFSNVSRMWNLVFELGQ